MFFNGRAQAQTALDGKMRPAEPGCSLDPDRVEVVRHARTARGAVADSRGLCARQDSASIEVH